MIALLLLLLPTFLASADLGPQVSRPALFALRLPPQPVQIASYYHLPGRKTASGALYGGMTAAHRTLPMGSIRTLCREDRPTICAQVTVRDRGPYVKGRDWDVTQEVAQKLCMVKRGLLKVRVRN
jgi:rare lipoprotein A